MENIINLVNKYQCLNVMDVDPPLMHYHSDGSVCNVAKMRCACCGESYRREKHDEFVSHYTGIKHLSYLFKHTGDPEFAPYIRKLKLDEMRTRTKIEYENIYRRPYGCEYKTYSNYNIWNLKQVLKDRIIPYIYEERDRKREALFKDIKDYPRIRRIRLNRRMMGTRIKTDVDEVELASYPWYLV